MRYYIIAGEASGDLHGSNLIKSLLKNDSEAQVRCFGGDMMKEAGASLAKHYNEMAFMGFFEVIKNLPKIFQNIKFCKNDIKAFKPNVIIFIDFSGFNLRIAKWAKQQGFKTNYYISPQVWASRKGRINQIKRDIDKMYVILPFEREFYAENGYEVEFVGHPLLDAIQNTDLPKGSYFRSSNKLHPEKPIIALLPGSRRQEVQKMLTVMLSVQGHFSNYQFVIAGAPSLDSDFYEPFIKNSKVGYVSGQTYALLKNAHAALVTSGTATLETALFKVPQVVCYRGNWISYQIAKRIITLDFISLVNLIMGKEVVKELIQTELTTQNLIEELSKVLSDAKRNEILSDYDLLEKKLGGEGASDRAAQLIIQNT